MPKLWLKKTDQKSSRKQKKLRTWRKKSTQANGESGHTPVRLLVPEFPIERENLFNLTRFPGRQKITAKSMVTYRSDLNNLRKKIGGGKKKKTSKKN